MKITVLSYLEKEDATEHDPVVDQIAGALKVEGHEVSVLGVHADLEKLVEGIRQREPELIFNVMEGRVTAGSCRAGRGSSPAR